MSISINGNLFKPWIKRSISMENIPGLNGYVVHRDSTCQPVYSTYYHSTPAKIRPNIVAALCQLLSILYLSDKKDYGAIGEFTNNGNLCYAFEIVQRGIREAAVAIPKSGTYTVSAMTESSMYALKEGHQNGVLLLMTAIFFEVIKPNTDDEFKKEFKSIRDIFKEGVTGNNLAELSEHFAVFSENVYRRLMRSNINVQLLTESGNVSPITNLALRQGKYIPKKTYGREFHILDTAEGDTSSPCVSKASQKINREWTEKEKEMIPVMPEWYIEPTEVGQICQLITKSTGTYKPKRNFMLRGPSSTGKTSMARAIAAELGMPYMFITCSSDTESSAFLGEPMYDKNGNVKYVESPFINAIKNGYLIEVQEPYVIAKQGVLTALNGLLDDSAGVTLATGEFVKRHPDCIVIFTTNVSYVGCKKPNQSVLRRMNGVYDIDMPNSAEIRKRVIANTGFANQEILRKIVKCASEINNYLQKEMIDDGVCGVSEIIDWVSTIQIEKDIVDAAKSTIVSKATDDPLEQAKILALVEAAFQNTVYDSSAEETVRKIIA